MSALHVTDPRAPEHVEDSSSRPPVVNLLDDLDGLADRLGEAVAAKDWLDSFLLAAGMNQVVEDYLHRDVFMLERVASILERVNRHVARPARVAQRVALSLREWSAHERRVRAWQRALANAVEALAEGVVRDAVRSHAAEAVAEVVSGLAAMPRDLRRTILRMPTCFQSLDQDPADCVLLAARFADRWPNRARPVRVLGLRTSGSYLAPLLAESLRMRGYRDVKAWTVRPSDRLYREERDRLVGLIDSDTIVAVIDDPPKSGSSLVRAVEWLERRGLARDRIVMLVPLTGSAGSLPRALASYQTVVLPLAEWTVHSRLRDESVRQTLHDLLPARDLDLTAVRRTPLPPISDLKSGSPVRRHARAVFEVETVDGFGRRTRRHVYAKGVGAGYFGRHSLTVANAVAGFVPETYGLRDGLLFREWFPEAARLPATDATSEVLGAISDYVLARRSRLGVAGDVSERMAGLNPVWQRVADVLATSFGRARPLLRPLTHAAARRLLRVERPSVIDGSMSLTHWFRGAASDTPLVKVDYDERAYSNQDTVVDQLYSFDAVYDLAAAAVDLQLGGGHDAAGALRRGFEAKAGPVGEERWFLYQLIVLKSYRQFLEAMRREAAEGALTDLPAEVSAMLEAKTLAGELGLVSDTMSRIDQRYWSGLVLDGVEPTEEGPVCAIDIDGVLETAQLGYSSVTEAGALALRSLIAHGHRPVLVTGRSIADVRDRCQTFGLAGGVAEYGSALYCTRGDRVRDLRGPDAQRELELLKTDLASQKKVHVHSGYTHSVRASLVTDAGLRPLPEGLICDRIGALKLGSRVRAVEGWLQTDFMVTGIDKGTGARALLEELGARERDLAFAIGDSAEDVPLMKMATYAMGPRNAAPPLAASGARLMRGRYQAGVTEAVAMVIGHRPGGCDRCRPPAQSADAKLLLAALGAQQSGRMIKLRQAWRLATQVRRSR